MTVLKWGQKKKKTKKKLVVFSQYSSLQWERMCEYFKRYLKVFQLSADLGYSVNSKYFSAKICVYRSSNTADKRDSETKQRSLSLSNWSWRRGKICTWTNLSHTQMNAKHTHAADSEWRWYLSLICHCFGSLLSQGDLDIWTCVLSN